MELRRGDVVEVRSAGEILATLDARGALEALPFIEEMMAWCGQRLTVDANAERMCDTIEWSGSRRIPDTYMIGTIRCDGSAHDGCETYCRFLWKGAWLRKAHPGAPPTQPSANDATDRDRLRALVAANTRQPGSAGDRPLHRCQLTELFRASSPGTRFPYLDEVRSGNVTLGEYLPVIGRAVAWETRRKLGHWPEHCFQGRPTPLRRPPLDLQPGEWIRIRPAHEIEETIDAKGGTRGLWFDREMLQYCGQTFRVKKRVTRFIHDDGKFVNLKSAALMLEGVTCKGHYSVGRWFCRRYLHPYWREDWVERLPGPEGGV